MNGSICHFFNLFLLSRFYFLNIPLQNIGSVYRDFPSTLSSHPTIVTTIISPSPYTFGVTEVTALTKYHHLPTCCYPSVICPDISLFYICIHTMYIYIYVHATCVYNTWLITTVDYKLLYITFFSFMIYDHFVRPIAFTVK